MGDLVVPAAAAGAVCLLGAVGTVCYRRGHAAGHEAGIRFAMRVVLP